MRLNLVLFAVGVLVLQHRAALPPLVAGWLITTAILIGAVAGRLLSWPMLARSLSLLAWTASGFMWAATCATVRLADELPVAWEGRDVVVSGVVATLPQKLERGLRFEFDVESVLTPDARVPRRVLLSWWGAAAPDLPTPAAGERWRFTVRLKRPHGMVNPNGYDYEAWLLERGLRATGNVRGRGAEREAARVHHPAYWIESARGALRDRIRAGLEARPYAGILAALAIGDQRAIPADQWQTFTRTGVNHLMSISGLHITMLSGLVFSLVSRGWRRSARFPLILPARKAAVLAGLATAIAYTLLAGFAVPAQRTLYMLAVVAAGLWFGVFTSATRVLALAVFVVVVLDPWAVLSPGFWLSFGAVAVILHATLHRAGRSHWLAAWGRAQLAVTVGLVPMLLAMFQQVSVVSPLANALAIPVVSLAVVPMILIGMVLPFDAVLHLAHMLMAGCMAVLELMSRLPTPVWEQHAPPAWSVALALGGALWLLLPRGFPARYLGAVAMLPLFLVLPPRLSEGAASVTVLDVGQGLSVVVRTRDHALVYDTGPAYGPGADAGGRIVVPFLRAAGVKRLDGLVLTHDDADHTGGALTVLQSVPVAWVLSTLPDADPLLFYTDHDLRCQAGLGWTWDGVRFDVLHPPPGSDAVLKKDNDRSCVIRISTSAGSLLLPADIELRGEQVLLAAHGDKLASDVLVAPHQGSRTSSTREFVAAVAARAVIFPAGYRNRFGHPHEAVVARYRSTAARLYRTDLDGAVRIDLLPGGGMTLQGHRSVYRRYWHDPPLAERMALDGDEPTFLH